jgi:hypothetical protein
MAYKSFPCVLTLDFDKFVPRRSHKCRLCLNRLNSLYCSLWTEDIRLEGLRS